MEHKKRVIFLKIAAVLVILAAAAAAVGADSVRRTQIVAGVPCIEQDEWQALTGGEQIPFDPDALTWQGQRPAYESETNTLYLSQSTAAADYTGTLAARGEGVELRFLKDARMCSKKTAIAQGTAFSLLVITPDGWQTAQVVFTGLPTLTIRGGEEEYAELVLTDPENRDGAGGVTAAGCRYHVRGATSVAFPKKSYKVSLCTPDGEKVKENLLGLRKDDDWILNAMYTDSSYLREKTAYSLWSDLTAGEEAAPKSAQLEYVELFINDSLRGLYALEVPVDAKQVKAEEGDVLYKIGDHVIPEDADFKANTTGEVLTTREGRTPMEIRWPKSPAPADWDPMRQYRSLLYGGQSEAPVTVRMDRRNAVDYYLFCQFTFTMDNEWKNCYVLADLQKDGSFVMRRIPWDLDFTFGNHWDDDDRRHITFDPMSTAQLLSWQSSDYAVLSGSDPDGMEALLCQTWQDWRKRGLSARTLCAQVLSERQRLEDSGALAREYAHWPECSDPDAMTHLTDWITARFETMDRLYGAAG